MKRINDYFVKINQNRTIEKRISLCGKLEAIVGNYFLSGAGVPGECVETLYYDSKIDFYDCVPLLKKNIVAYIVENETVAFVRAGMMDKFQADTEEYGLVYIPVESFEAEEFYLDTEMEIPHLLESIIWVDDDFMSDENIEFDFETFDIIDSGEKYLNPKHFSVENLIDAIK
jgi:hypothetical protein